MDTIGFNNAISYMFMLKSNLSASLEALRPFEKVFEDGLESSIVRTVQINAHRVAEVTCSFC